MSVSVPTLTPEPAAARKPTLELSGENTPVPTLLREMWRGRHLLFLLARKEFHVRYRRASFGMLWAVALPLLQSAVLAIIFSRVVRAHLVAHYAPFVLIGMAPWTYFSTSFSSGATGIVDQADISSRVYFPRALLPMVAVFVNLYAFGITTAIVLALTPILGGSLGLPVLFLVPGFALAIALASGLCLTISALHVYFRDMRYVVAASLLVWLYVSPVIYPPTAVPHALRLILDINPLTGIVDLFHQATVGASGALLVPVLISAAWSLVLLVTGILLQARYDRVFADLL